MKKYPKINSIFKRDDRGRFTEEYSQPEFELLKDMPWEATEKIDGECVGVHWAPQADILSKPCLWWGVKGADKRTQRAGVDDMLSQIFSADKLTDLGYQEMSFFGEAFGGNIQKAGPRYRPTGVSFILFDVYCGHFWLRREDVDDIAKKLQIPSVPVLGALALDDAIRRVSGGFNSLVASDRSLGAEGMILRAPLGLLDRMGRRIITKVKTKDFLK